MFVNENSADHTNTLINKALITNFSFCSVS
jgi:hypothetical protein